MAHALHILISTADNAGINDDDGLLQRLMEWCLRDFSRVSRSGDFYRRARSEKYSASIRAGMVFVAS